MTIKEFETIAKEIEKKGKENGIKSENIGIASILTAIEIIAKKN